LEKDVTRKEPLMIKRILGCTGLLLLATAMLFRSSYAEVDWEVLQRLEVDSAPLDVAVSPDGKYIFVLTDNARIDVYDADGTYNDTLRLDEKMDQMRMGPEGDRLFVSSRASKTVKIIRLDFIHTIDTAGSPFKGPAGAPVEVAVFSDFE
jgi:DNA-binding beta-propeller fold protein YncE